MRKSILLFSAIITIIFAFKSNLIAQSKVPFFQCDSVVVTCEALYPLDPVVAIFNVNGIAGQPNNTNWSTPAVNGRHGITAAANDQFNKTNLGQVFGICYKPTGEIFVSSTKVFSSTAWGSNPAINQKATPLGSTPNSGSIYRIDATSIVEFAELPNRGQGLGNMCYDALHDKIYVTNFFDGLIYIIDGITGAYTGWDPNFDGYAGSTAGTYPAFWPLGQRPWGIACFGTTVNNVVLYYSRWSADLGNTATGKQNEIWSVNLNTFGAPTGLETLVYSVPFLTTNNYSNPVADLEISRGGTRMLLAERSMSGSSPSAHQSRLLEITRSSATSTLWSGQPVGKFKLGGNAGIYGTNCTGGADYGQFDLTVVNGAATRACDSSVWGMSDFMYPVTFGSGTGAAYGVQVLNSYGGDLTNSKIIDLNNVSGTQDKTRIGDVDYFRCLDCATQTDLCSFYASAPVDSICCRASLVATQTTGIPAVTSIGYTVTGGVVQGFTAGCIIASPNSYTGTTTGTVTFVGACTNLQFINAALSSTNATGNVTVTWTVNFANGTACSYQSIVKNCPHPVLRCDSFAIKQCVCTGSALSYIDINVFNHMLPNSPICSLKIEKFDATNTLQTGFWATGAVLIPLGVAFTSPWTTVPSSGPALNVNTGNNVEPQLYFSGSFTGSIIITVYHCNGDSCVRSWKPKTIDINNPTYADATLVQVKPPYPKNYVVSFKLKPENRSDLLSLVAKYFTIGISDVGTNAVKPEIVAVTGSQMYKERDINSLSLPLAKASYGRENALFELSKDFSLADSSQYIHVVFGGSLPKQIQTTFYEENGGVININTIKLDSLLTGLVDPTKVATPAVMLVSASPNPSKDAFNLKILINEVSLIQLEIFDVSGKLVDSQNQGTLLPGQHSIDISTVNLPNGTYLIKVGSAIDNAFSSIKMIVVH